MALKNFVDYIGPVVSAAWLNAVDKLKFTVFDDAETKAAARTALTSDAPWSIAQGGTGATTYDGARTNLGITDVQLEYPQTPLELAQGVTPTDTFYRPFDVRRYGAKPTSDGTADATENRTAFATALSLAQVGGGATVTMGEGLAFDIDGSLSMGTMTKLSGGRGQIIQTVNNTPILVFNMAAFNNFLAVEDVWLKYETQQTTSHTASAGIQLAEANKMSFNVYLNNIQIDGAYIGIYLPELTGCDAFLVKARGVTINQAAHWGVSIEGNASGARTNINFESCWVLNQDGSEISTARGFQFKRIHGLSIDNCGCDHIHNWPLLATETCEGTIGTFWAESCELAITSGGPGSYFNFAQSNMEVGLLYAEANNVSVSAGLDWYAIFANTSSKVGVGTWRDYNTTKTGTGTYYGAGADTSSYLSVDRYLSGGNTPALILADASVPPHISPWNGEDMETGVITMVLADSGASTNTNVVYTKSGNLVHLKFNQTTITRTSGDVYIATLPVNLRPARWSSSMSRVFSNVEAVGVMEIDTNGVINLFAGVTGGTAWGSTAGISHTTVVYSLV